MVNGFENQTKELSEYELKILVPAMVAGLKTKTGKDNAITSGNAINKMKDLKFKINPARFRKIINYIRIHGLIFNLVASSKGYYIATNQSEREMFIESLDQRINSITKVRDAMFYQKNK